jgi:hypothetical protein
VCRCILVFAINYYVPESLHVNRHAIGWGIAGAIVFIKVATTHA